MYTCDRPARSLVLSRSSRRSPRARWRAPHSAARLGLGRRGEPVACAQGEDRRLRSRRRHVKYVACENDSIYMNSYSCDPGSLDFPRCVLDWYRRKSVYMCHPPPRPRLVASTEHQPWNVLLRTPRLNARGAVGRLLHTLDSIQECGFSVAVHAFDHPSSRHPVHARFCSAGATRLRPLCRSPRHSSRHLV